ncbi:hypothetical protein INT44_002195 [Umbelopsis vinacea]|uniref:Uncharacterized protein n=1 Tax=Umbelopsis vinacea TaxID=44442 RepID=A0A8H7Q5I6_9FUNG|nr:hypothetical protein INT44_002195 [Umbelopsis vinacea]
MRLFKLCIGCYGQDDHDFAMYFFDSPITPPGVGGNTKEDNFWKIEDLQAIFHSKPITIHHIAPTYRFSYDYIRRDAHGHHYIAACALLDLASYMQIELLGQLCRLSRQDIQNGKAEMLCKSLDIRVSRTHMMIENEFIPSDLTPPSPMTPSQSNYHNVQGSNKRKAPTVESTTSSSSGKQSLLAKRLAGKHRALTIYAAPYAEQTSAVRTAPAKQYSDQLLLAPPIVQSQQKQIYPYQPPQRHSQPHLRPFEDLFDTIEATRSLKETLDDQVRRSAHVINEFNPMSVKQIVEAEMMAFQQQMDAKLECLLTECSNRLSKLESTPSSSPSLSDLLCRIEKLENRADPHC